MLNNQNHASKNEVSGRRAYTKPELVSRGNILAITKGGSGIPFDGNGSSVNPGGES
jgi:hypothetical protein